MREHLEAIGDHIRAFLRDLREGYASWNRFMRMRVWILSGVGADVLLVSLYVLIGTAGLDVEVWFERGFPSNMLVVRNHEGAVLERVRLVLDDKYAVDVEKLEPGANGFEVNRAFRDQGDTPPADDYVPRHLEIVIRDDAQTFSVISRETGGAL